MQHTQQQSSSKKRESSSRPVPRFFARSLVAGVFAALGAGLLASLLSVVLMGILRLAAGIPTPVELFSYHVLKLLSADTFVNLLVKFAPNSKTIPLGLALLGMIGLGTLLGLLYVIVVRGIMPAKGYRPSRREGLTAAALAIIMTLAGVLLFWGELGENFLGLPVGWARLVTALSLFAEFSLYSVTLCLAYRALLPKQSVPGTAATMLSRRQLLARAGVATLSLGAAAASFGLVREYLSRYASYDGLSAYPNNGMTSPITPNSKHYVVTQNPIDPTPNLDVWRLEIAGLVGTSGSYTYEEVQKLPSTSRAITLECIANGVGGGLISTAIWQGVPLRTLLERHGGALPDARYVTFTSVDGYVVSQPLDEVLAVDALLAWRMNGSELPLRHGFPLRVLVPGRYGEESPKWLTRVELTDHFVGGLYSDQGWYNGQLHTTSRIDRPRGHLPLGRSIEVGGIAFAGARGISKVEVSVDGGSTWHVATLEPPLSQDSWVFWTWQWMPSLPGKYRLVARATDGTGEVQTSRMQITVPNGSTGYHQVMVEVG